jgi:hypothetical protein
MAYKTDPKHREFVAHFMVQGCGALVQWNAVDIVNEGFLYQVRLFWRAEARWWIQFRWFSPKGGHTVLTYSEGKKYREVVGWKLCGPLIRFTRDEQTPT